MIVTGEKDIPDIRMQTYPYKRYIVDGKMKSVRKKEGSAGHGFRNGYAGTGSTRQGKNEKDIHK